jgi:hypothetical protein
MVEIKWEIVNIPKRYIEIVVNNKIIKLELVPDFEDGIDVYEIIDEDL